LCPGSAQEVPSFSQERHHDIFSAKKYAFTKTLRQQHLSKFCGVQRHPRQPRNGQENGQEALKELQNLHTKRCKNGTNLVISVWQFWDQFWAPQWIQNGFTNSRQTLTQGTPATLEPKMPPRWPKMARDGPRMAPRWPQDGPTCPVMVPRWPQDGPKMAPRCPKMPQGGPKVAQHCRKML